MRDDGVSLYSSLYVSTPNIQFFFIKQRTVRPMSSPSRLEKFTLLLTLSVIPFAVFLAIVTQVEQNKLDGTGVVYIPIYTIVFMTLSDATISSLFLWLFIAPLRETIRNNKMALRKDLTMVANVMTNRTQTQQHQLQTNTSIKIQVTPPSTVAVAATSNPSITSAQTPDDRPQLNTALEAVMRKNTKACIFTVTWSFISMAFISWSHIANEPYSRKWVVPAGCVDVMWTGLAITYIMHKPRSVGVADIRRNQIQPMMMMMNTNVCTDKNPHKTSLQNKTGSSAGAGLHITTSVAPNEILTPDPSPTPSPSHKSQQTLDASPMNNIMNMNIDSQQQQIKNTNGRKSLQPLMPLIPAVCE